VAATLRTVITASENDWNAVAWSESTGSLIGQSMERLNILDRVGGGDSFASGLIYGLLEERPLAEALQFGIAHGALAMTTPGDTSMVTQREVENLVQGGSARVQR
jgi:2-dehydro-3-deoxygluconokinase